MRLGTDKDDEGRGDRPVEFRGVAGRNAGFDRETVAPPPVKGNIPPAFGPSVNEPQETIQIRNPRPESQPYSFKLTVSFDGSDFKWRVSSTRSTVTDGTNGNMIDLSPSGTDWGVSAIKFDVDTTISASKHIVLKCDIDGSLVATNWTLAAVDDPSEVITSGSPAAQDTAQLLIGKVTIDTVPNPDTATATQAIKEPQRLTHGFLNGIETRVFVNAPLHPDAL